MGRHNEESIPGLCTKFLCPQCKLLGAIEFIDRRFDRAIIIAPQIYQSGSADLRPFHEVCQCIELFSGIRCAALGINAYHELCLVKYREARTLEYRVELNERHAEADVGRSEEHTSELQSLMRISYAVFCLKTKKSTPNNNIKKKHIPQTQRT